MTDVQSQQDLRGVYLNEVGIRRLRIPLSIKDTEGVLHPTVAEVSLSVDLDPMSRGTHMSRFVETVRRFQSLSPKETRTLLEDLLERLPADAAYLRMNFPYFVPKKAPVSGIVSMLDVDCRMESSMKDGVFEHMLGVTVPITTLCPCSKEISEYGAHNQRADVRLDIYSEEEIGIEELVNIAESGASSTLYSLLKRPDEKYVTELAYENPRFVEDAVREVYQVLDRDERIYSFRVEVESMESIHNHNAFATAIKTGRQK